MTIACPSPPDWRLDWSDLEARFAELRSLEGCAQDETHHAEGDVAVHTRLACEALLAHAEFRAMNGDDREVVFLATLLHDLGKPSTTRREEGRITSRGHGLRGAILARRLLWNLGMPLARRELVCALIRRHHVPLFAVDRPDPQREIIEASLVANCRMLALVAESDARGRVCADGQRLLDQIELFRELCLEEGCMDTPRCFESEAARFAWLRSPGRAPDAPVHFSPRCEAVLLSGLPGSGKDTWIERCAPDRAVVSLDELRSELGVDPDDEQGAVVFRAKEEARRLLRAGRDFVWNATNLSRKTRGALTGLFAGYDARVRIVYVEVGPEQQRLQNRKRAGRVPDQVIGRMLDRWEVPDVLEAHAVEWVEQASLR